MSLSLTDTAITELVNRGYDSVYGARPLRRIIQRDILNPLAVDILEGKYQDGDVVCVDYENDCFVSTQYKTDSSS